MDQNDETCGLCGEGGDLICCDNCPAVFHQTCLNIKEVPPGDWHCIQCCCKFCGSYEKSENQQNPNYGCLMLACQSCRKKYHKNCLEANIDETVQLNRSSICGKSCQQMLERLEMLLVKKHDIGDGFSCTFCCKTHDINSNASKMDVVLSIMYECFQPVYIDHGGKRIELIPDILSSRWSSSYGVNYDGFFTVLLEKGNDTISFANIRIHGNQMAEMPFIGTRIAYRKQGMCRRLLNFIESFLSYLNVEKLVIPSAQEVIQTWTHCFGFEPFEMSTTNFVKDKNVVQFHGAKMLQKKIQKHNISGENLNFNKVLNFFKRGKAIEKNKVVKESHVKRESLETMMKNNCDGSFSRRRKRSSTLELRKARETKRSSKSAPNS